MYVLIRRRWPDCWTIFSPVKIRRAGRWRSDLKSSIAEAMAFLSFSAAAPSAKALQCFSSAVRFDRTRTLIEFACEVCRAEVGVALERLDRFVATDSPYLDRVQTPLKKTGHRLVSKVVKP